MSGSMDHSVRTTTGLEPSAGINSGGADNDIFLLHVDIQRGEGLVDTQFLIPQDPYVKVVLPDGTSERTKCVSGGGTDPEWNTSHGEHITLELNRGNTPCSLRIQVWNENDGYFESDDMIGSAEAMLQLDQLQMTAEQRQEGTHAENSQAGFPTLIYIVSLHCSNSYLPHPGKATHSRRIGLGPQGILVLEMYILTAAKLESLEEYARNSQNGARKGNSSTEVDSLLEAVAVQAKPSKKQKYQLNFLRFSTILIDELSVSLRTIFMQLWNNRYPDNHWGAVSNTVSGVVCWDGTAFTIDSNMTVKMCSRKKNNNLHTETTLEQGVAYLKAETGTLAVNDKMMIGDQVCIVQNIKNNSKRVGGSTITVNTLTAFDGSLSIFVQKIKYERKVTDQMRIPFARKVRAGEIGEWDISLLMFLLCNSSHVLLQQDCDAEGLKLLGNLRKLRNNSFGHIGNCSLSDVELRSKIAVVLKFADSALNQDDLKERVTKVMSEQYSFPNTTAADVQRWDEAQESWETHFKELNGKINTLGTQVAKLASTSEAADSLTHAKLDALGQLLEEVNPKNRRLLMEGVSLEDKALGNEILALLEGAENQRLVMAKRHIKEGNVMQAYTCIKQTISADTLLPEDLAEAKILFAYTCNKLGHQCLRENKFVDAAIFFGDLLDNRATYIVGERLQTLRRFHACSLYETGKQARLQGNWETAAEQFCLARETKMLPGTLSNKCGGYLHQCKERCKALRVEAKMGEATAKVAVAQNEEDAFSLYKKAKRDLRLGNIGIARALFKDAQASGLPNGLEERTADYIDKLDDMEEEHIAASSTTCVFDHATHNLGLSMSTVGMLGLSTKTLLAGTLRTNHSSRELIMVLDDKFPPNSKARGALILQLKVNIRKALDCLAEIQIIDIENGSIIVRFRFVSENTDKASQLEEEYLQQVDNKKSRLYEGDLTCRIDQKRTQIMTMSLGTSANRLAPRRYEVGDTITLAEIAEEKIECQVDSLLGEGTTASVFKVTAASKASALKVFKAGCSFLDLSEEASLLLTANYPQSHPHVLRVDFVWYEQRTNEMFFLMSHVDGDNLQTWMDDERLYKGTIDEQQHRLIVLTHQLVCAVRHLHQRGILHQDIKPDNVLMTAAGKPVLGDFGVASKGTVDTAGVVEAMLRGCTPVYASPYVRELFFQVKVLPENQRKAFLVTRKITHLDDFWAMAATMIDTFAECGWRRGRSVAEVLVNSSRLVELLSDSKLMRVALPSGMLGVLQHCLGFGAAPTEGPTTNSPTELMSTAFACSPVLTEVGLNGKRCANIYNNLAVALSDDGHHGKALTLLEQAVAADRDDARSKNNLGVVKLAQGEVDGAMRCFHEALKIEPDHPLATFNASMKECREDAIAQFDRSGAVGAVEDRSGQIELADAISFAPAQQIDVHRQGNWQRVDAISSTVPLLLLKYRIPTTELNGSTTLPAAWYTVDVQRLFILYCGEWRIGKVDKHFQREFDQENEEAKTARSKLDKVEGGTNKQLSAEEEKETQQHRQDEQQHKDKARQLASKHRILVEMRHSNSCESVALQLNEANHAPALFVDCCAMEQAAKSYKLELVDKHAAITDIFSGQQLSTRTQTATLEYHEADHTVQGFNGNDDVDSKYQQARKAASNNDDSPSQRTRLGVTSILHRMCSGGSIFVLILGPAASGKTTLLKTLIMAIVNQHGDLVPILIPIIEVVRVLSECEGNNGKSVVAAFLQHRYPQHAHLLLQMMLMHRVVFFIDGIDESGSSREAVEDFVTVELLKCGHKTVITSRHSGFSSDGFKQCQLVELLPLSVEQQSQMVRTRVPDGEQADQFVQELGSDTFKEISSNPLMLTMMISIYLNNNCKLISNRSELYEKALRTIMFRSDKERAGLEESAQDDLFEHLQKLASGSHQRDGERRVFTNVEAAEWVGRGGWESIQTAVHSGQLPIIVSTGPNDKDEEEYRFGHMSYQEYLVAREYYQRLTSSRFSTQVVVELFGGTPANAFADVKQQLMLQLLSSVFSPKQLAMCAVVLAGGKVALMTEAFTSESTACAVTGCHETQCNIDGYCQKHHAEAAAALAMTALIGGKTLKIVGNLGSGGAETLVPFVKAHQMLQSLDVGGTELQANGVRLLAGALRENTTITHLDISGNSIEPEGAQIVAEAIKVTSGCFSYVCCLTCESDFLFNC
jgi:tetratricopeptide (TPR) repeat protein